MDAAALLCGCPPAAVLVEAPARPGACSASRPASSHVALRSPHRLFLSLGPLPPAAWLHLPEADRALAAFNARAAGSEPGGRPLAKELFFQEDMQGEVGAAFLSLLAVGGAALLRVGGHALRG